MASYKKLDKSTNKNIISTAKGGVIHFSALEVGINFVSFIVLGFVIILIALVVWYFIVHKKNIVSSFNKVKEKAENYNGEAITEEQDEDEDEFI